MPKTPNTSIYDQYDIDTYSTCVVDECKTRTRAQKVSPEWKPTISNVEFRLYVFAYIVNIRIL